MNPDRSGFTQTTSKITLDLPAAVCIDVALEREIEALERRLGRAKRPDTVRAIENRLANTRAAVAAFDPAYRATLDAPLFTPEHEALIAKATGS